MGLTKDARETGMLRTWGKVPAGGSTRLTAGEYTSEKKKAAYIYIHTDSHRISTDTQCTAIEIYTMIATSLYTAMAIHHALIQILSNPTHSQRFPKPSISSSPLQPYFYRH